ncbi:MAG: 50S ribosomal protein L34e [Nanoarchaeota archaeon]
MPSPRRRSRSLRIVYKKLPGGRLTIHYHKKKPSKAQCAGCGRALAGVPRERPYKMRNLPKTMKRPERMFGGIFCTVCSRRKLKDMVRK